MKYWIGIGISVALLALFALTVDVGRMLDALGGANYWYVAPAVAAYLASVWIRSMRWAVMLRHFRPVTTRRLYPVVTIGYMANNLLPMRLGEMVRAYYVGEREGINKASALASVFAERVFDALTLLFIIAVVSLFAPLSSLTQAFGDQLGVPAWVIVALFTAPFFGAFGAMMLLALYPSRSRALFALLARPLPRRAREALDSLVGMLLDALTPLRSPRKLAALFGLSLPIWLSEAVVFWLIGLQFGIEEAHAGALQMAANMALVMALANIGGSLPAAPGGIGIFELVAREALVYGPLATVDRSVAAGFAVVSHAVILLPMIILGQIFLWMANLSLRRLSREGR